MNPAREGTGAQYGGLGMLLTEGTFKINCPQAELLAWQGHWLCKRRGYMNLAGDGTGGQYGYGGRAMRLTE